MPHLRTSQRASLLRPTAVNDILAEVRAFEQRGGQAISLMRGQPDFPTPAHIVTAANEALAKGRTGYPNNQGEPTLREAVARKLARAIEGRGAERYSPENQILITTGATLGIYAALAAGLDPGDEVLIPVPIYDAYAGVIAVVGGTARPVPARIVENRYALDPEAFAAACNLRTRAMLLNTPWNPTGSVLRLGELSDLMRVAAEHDLIVISDEIYEALVYDGRPHISPAAVSDDARRRTILTNSFSKTYAMTGWRLGYCAGPAELIRAMYLVLQQSSRGPATFVQDAGVAALNGGEECITAMREEYAARRQRVAEILSGLRNVKVLLPEGGFFAMVDVHELGVSSDEIRRRLLTEFGVVVVHGAAYGPSAEGMLRVSFASGGQNLQSGLERLRAGLEALGPA